VWYITAYEIPSRIDRQTREGPQIYPGESGREPAADHKGDSGGDGFFIYRHGKGLS